jgi:hypothetical protein
MNKVVYFCLFLICSGMCIAQEQMTLIQPQNEDSTLLIGATVLRASNFPAQPPFNGIRTGGIEIHLQDPKTKELVKLSSEEGSGCFYLFDPKSETYRVTRVYISVESAGYTRELYTTIDRNIRIHKGKVNNLGLLQWYADNETGDITIYYNDNYAPLKEWIRESTQGNSPWLHNQWEQWVDIAIE